MTCRDQLRTKIIEMDYGMEGGVLRMKLCAVTACYILRQWSEHRLRSHEYGLWLKDHLAIYGVRSVISAPGFPQANAAASIDD